MEISSGLLSDIYNLMFIVAIFAFISKNNNREKEKWYKYLIVVLFIIVISKLMSEAAVCGVISNIISLTGTFLLFALTPLVGCFIIKYSNECMDYGKNKNNILLIICLLFSAVNFIILCISQIFSLDLLYKFDGTTYGKGILYDIRIFLIAIEYMSMQVYIIYLNKKNKQDLSVVLWIFPIYTLVVTILQFSMKNMTHNYADVFFYSVLLYIYVQSRDLNTDFLTGAVNRRKFDAELTKRVNNASEVKFSGIMADIDKFKYINDTYGHQAGDDALEAFSDIVIKNFRKTDIVARYGGDEFCILTDICDEAEIEVAMNRLRRSLDDFNALGKFPFDISFSLGYAVYDCEVDGSSAAFLKRLDERMYQEKEIHHQNAAK